MLLSRTPVLLSCRWVTMPYVERPNNATEQPSLHLLEAYDAPDHSACDPPIHPASAWQRDAHVPHHAGAPADVDRTVNFHASGSMRHPDSCRSFSLVARGLSASRPSCSQVLQQELIRSLHPDELLLTTSCGQPWGDFGCGGAMNVFSLFVVGRKRLVGVYWPASVPTPQLVVRQHMNEGICDWRTGVGGDAMASQPRENSKTDWIVSAQGGHGTART
jgi:hypothetical protein